MFPSRVIFSNAWKQLPHWSINSRHSLWHHLINYYYELEAHWKTTTDTIIINIVLIEEFKSTEKQKEDIISPSLIIPNPKMLIPHWWAPKLSALTVSFSPWVHALHLSRVGGLSPWILGWCPELLWPPGSLQRCCCAQSWEALLSCYFPSTSCHEKSDS